jgi:hypothetical protein
MEYAFSPTAAQMSIRFAFGLCAFVCVGCGTARPDLDSIAEGYVRTTLMMAQHDPSLVEGWRGPASWNPGPRRPVADLQREVDRLQQQVEYAASDISNSIEHARVRYLSAQIRALRFAVERQLGRAATIDEQARDEFGVEFATIDRHQIDLIHGRLSRALRGQGPLSDRVSALRRATAIPRARRLEVLRAALDVCRAAMPEQLPLPHEDRISMVLRDALGWDAFLKYGGNGASELAVNDDSELDVARALHLACHEGYPGHHVQHLLIDRIHGERQLFELLLVPGFGPHLLLTEGAAEVGADLAMPPQHREAVYRNTLLPAAGIDPAFSTELAAVDGDLVELLPVVTDVARTYLAGGITQEEAIERLTHDALVANPRGTLAFIERRRARALVYGEGRRIVYSAMNSRDLSSLLSAFRRVAALQ